MVASCGCLVSAAPAGCAAAVAHTYLLACMHAYACVRVCAGGDAALAEVYSPHLDTHQRVTLLECLAAAAYELADPSK